MDALVESDIFSYEIIEDKRSDGRLKLRGIYQLSDTRNRNKRVYPRGLWEKVLAESGDFKRRLDSRLVLGELGHPADGKTNISNVSHLITKCWMDEAFMPECLLCKSNGGPHTHVMAEEEVLNTPEGKILQELYRAGVQLGVSSRGQGSVRGGSEEQVVADDYRLETFDHVLDPSTPGAYPTIISECVMHAVEKLIEPSCNPAELQGYRKILSEVRFDETGSGQINVDRLIETIDIKLASGEQPRMYPALGISTPIVWVPAAVIGQQDGHRDHTVATMEDTKMQISLDNPEVQTLVRRGVESVRDALEGRLAEAAAKIESLTASKREAEDKFDAAEKVGEELVSQLKNARFKLNALSEQVSHNQVVSAPDMYDDTHTLKEAFDASKGVIDDLLSRLDHADEAVQRADAAEALLAETIERVRRRGAIDKINSILATESASVSQRLRPILSECRSVEEVSRCYDALKSLISESKSTLVRKPIHVEETFEPKSDGLLPTVADTLSEQSFAASNAFSLTEASASTNQDLSRRIMRRAYGS